MKFEEWELEVTGIRILQPTIKIYFPARDPSSSISTIPAMCNRDVETVDIDGALIA
jgi:hypothetical protein